MNLFNKLSLYFHTIRYLKAEQIYYRVMSIARSDFKFIESSLTSCDYPPLTFIKFNKEREDLKAYFLNEKVNLKREKEQWSNPEKSLLWNFNLNYFDFLHYANCDDNQNELKGILEDHCSYNFSHEHVSNHPYPLSIRLSNVIKFLITNNIKSSLVNTAIFRQTQILTSSIEYSVGGNHLIANAKALIMSSFYLDCSMSKTWNERGVKLLKRCLLEQVNCDGVHLEESPMYQCLVLEDLIDLYMISPKEMSFLRKTILSMTSYLKSLIHLDGHLAYFNDSSEGVYKAPGDLISYVIKNIGEVSDFNNKSGLSSFENLHYKVIFKARSMGLSHVPGHIHNDALSFELSIPKTKVITNPGTSTYTHLERRLLEKSTSHHSTVSDKQNEQNQTWSLFRIAKRGSFKNHRPFSSSFTFFNKKSTHTRTLKCDEHTIRVHDQLKGLINAESKLFLMPEITAKINDNKVHLSYEGSDILKLTFENISQLHLSSYEYALSFEKLLEAQVIIFTPKNDSQFKIEVL